jgi:nitroimidazol reductase NimA-like FMN-containing flavoprotein (pyridoxamine 5'-phosphate oxidase superfamily)
MGRSFEYPQEAFNTVNRLGKKRGTYDLGFIHQIIQDTTVVHVSFAPSPEDIFPAILPMIGTMGSFSRPSAGLSDPLDCYLHGYVSSRLMNLTRAAIAAGHKGLPVSIAASKVDGLVLALTPNAHSYNYRSVVLFGYANLVTEVDEKLYAMELITNKVVPGRWGNSRVPPNAAEMSSTQILRVEIETASGKVRDNPPADEKCDLGDEDVLDRVWTGVVPLTEHFGEPVPSVYNRVKEVPSHITDYTRGFNEKEELYRKKLEGVVAGTNVKYGEV